MLGIYEGRQFRSKRNNRAFPHVFRKNLSDFYSASKTAGDEKLLKKMLPTSLFPYKLTVAYQLSDIFIHNTKNKF